MMMAVVGHARLQLPGRALAVRRRRRSTAASARSRCLFSVTAVGSLMGALSRARRSTHRDARRDRRVGRLRCGDAGARGRAERSRIAFPIGIAVGLDEHRVHDRVDRDRAGARRSRDARPGARAAGDRVPRQHARSADRCSARSATRTARAPASSSAAPPPSAPRSSAPSPCAATAPGRRRRRRTVPPADLQVA